ncbi:MAG: hypothetical protein Q8P02_05325 [Candidatus Micrarchaeota archaeon]|nr:hypothetical protein [Candidatus Micrarchaeota archaeon]
MVFLYLSVTYLSIGPWTAVVLALFITAALVLDEWLLALSAVMVSLGFALVGRISGAPTQLKKKHETQLEYQEQEQEEGDDEKDEDEDDGDDGDD